jgi:hypothetical protein
MPLLCVRFEFFLPSFLSGILILTPGVEGPVLSRVEEQDFGSFTFVDPTLKVNPTWVLKD